MLTWRKPTMDEAMQIGPEIMAPEIFEPSGLDVAAATYRIENPIASWVEGLNYRSEEADLEGYNPYEGLDPKYLPYSEAFQDARSPDQRRMLEARIDMQIQDRMTMAQGGGQTIAWSLAAGLGDPINLPLMLIPAARIGAGIAETAGTVAATGAVATGLSESLLHATQPTRTWQETMLAMGATTLLGGALGGLAGAGTKQTTKALEAATRDIEDIVKNGGLQDLPSGSAGAARVIGTLEEEASNVGPRWLGFNPLIRLMNSKSPSAVNFTNRTVRHNFKIGQNEQLKNSAMPVEVENLRMQQGMSAKYVYAMREQYADMLGAKTFTGARLRRGGMKFNEFSDEVGKAMRRGDTHEIPQVAAAAKRLREDVINPITRGYQELGDLPENMTPKFAKSYFPRMHNIREMEKRPGDWLDMVETHLINKHGAEATEAKDIARQIWGKIMNSPNGRLPRDIVGSSGRLKERTLDIEDEVLEANGFLINNADQVMQSFMRSTVPELNLKKEFGHHNLDGLIESVRSEYAVLVEKASSNKEKAALLKQEGKDIRDIQGIRDIMLGNHLPTAGDMPQLANMARLMRGGSFMANLGMMTVSAASDPYRIVVKHGGMAFARALPRALLYFGKKTKLAAREMEEFGIAVDNLMNSRIYAMAEFDEIGTRMEKWTRVFAKASLMNHWNSFWKKMAAFTAQNHFIGDALKYSSLPARRQVRLAQAGINKDMAGRIAEQSRAHGEKLGGSWHANTAQWTDREAADLFERVLLRDADLTINTPGVADRPLFMSNEMGKTLFQFKSFFLTAHNQTFIPMLQQTAKGDVAVLQGLFMGTMLGMMSEWARLHLSGRGDELENYSMQDWVRAGIDRAGLATVPMELFNMGDRLARGKLSESMGMTEGSRYFYRNLAGTLLGPAFGYGEDAAELLLNVAHSDGLSEKDIHAVRRLMPYQNIFYLRQLINEMEAQVVKQTGAKPNRRKRGNTKPIYIR